MVRCAADCPSGRGCPLSRRSFMASTAASPVCAGALLGADQKGEEGPLVKPLGPGSKVRVRIKAAFVRRRGPYGMRWPGAVYDGETARRSYTKQLLEGAARLGVRVDLRPEPVYSKAEAAAWVEACKAEKPDALLVLLLDRQEHSWPTCALAASSGIPTIIHSPLGTSFTTNTAPFAEKSGCLVCATDDFSEVLRALQMVKAHLRLASTRYVVLRGSKRAERRVPVIGTELRYLPAGEFLELYRKTPLTEEIKQVAGDFMRRAERFVGATARDVLNGVKSFVVARSFLKHQEADGITMDCLGALGGTKVSLPCISWAFMLDNGVPAACEADINAALTHALVLYLFDRPGFQQDPVPDTKRGTLIGAHCTCATRLRGLDQEPVEFYIQHHHGNRDAVPRPVWEPGQRVTVASLRAPRSEDSRPELIVSTGSVVENRKVPPAGGCVVSVEIRLDGVDDCLAYPGFHQLFFYGDFKRDLLRYCKLFDINPVVV